MKAISQSTTSNSIFKKRKYSEFKEKSSTFFETADAWQVFVQGSTLVLLLGAILMMTVLQKDFAQYNFNRVHTTFGWAFLMFSGVIFVFKAFYFVFILYRYFKYKPIASVSDEELPSCTIIVPAFNEGKQVWATLKSLSKSNYPVEKMQLICIDDGSQDDTWDWMQKAKNELGKRVEIYQQPKNMGKRHALYRGFNLGNGEVFITVDSDSEVDSNTLRNLMSPFVTNPECGAVAGNIRVLNTNKALLPKMLDVSFVLSFEFVRSAESTLNTVLCTPGALAAYRSEAVFNCLDQWINQTFMGQQSDIGEDRAMTNMILKQGYNVLFQRNAYAYTKVPENFRSLHKMFTRWGRSNVRENIQMAKYVFTDFRRKSKAGARLLFISQSVRIITCYPFLFFMVVFMATNPLLFLSSTLFSILIASTFPVIFYARRYNLSESFWAYSYSILYTFGLFWITPYAIATANRSGWLTRGLPKK